MKSYRCYFIAETGKAIDSVTIDAPTAADAARQAIQRPIKSPYVFVEVWDGTQRVLDFSNPRTPHHLRQSSHESDLPGLPA